MGHSQIGVDMDNARRALGADSMESGRRKVYADKNVVVETRKPDQAEQTDELAVPYIAERYTRRSYVAPRGQKLYEATGTNGVISVRASAIEMKFATCVADPNGTTTRQRQGMIRSFFPSSLQAEQQALVLRDRGLQVQVVAARPYRGQDGDRATDEE